MEDCKKFYLRGKGKGKKGNAKEELFEEVEGMHERIKSTT